MKMNRMYRCGFILFAVLCSLPLSADEYKLELLVFSQSTANTELFTETKSSITMPDNTIEISPAFSADQETLVDIPLDGLKKAAEKLSESSDYAILLQKAWKQKFTAGQTNPAIRLQDPNGSLTGYINFTESGAIVVKLDVEYVGANAAMNSNPLVYRLTEKRKLRSGEPQYFDHPKFGVIVLATNLTPPPPPPTPTPTPTPTATPNPTAPTGTGTPVAPASAVKTKVPTTQ